MSSIQNTLRKARCLFPAAALLALAGCANVERTFGLTRDAPDEFTVETRAPLSMPPDYSLRPPEPGAPRPQEVTSQQAAEAAIAPDTALGGAAGPNTAGQSALVQEAGTHPSETGGVQSPQGGLTDRLMFWKSAPTAGTLVDPSKESERLRENAALGQSPTNGATPVVQDKPKSSFLGLF